MKPVTYNKTGLRRAARALASALAILLLLPLAGCSALGRGIGDLFSNPRKEFYDKGVEAFENNDFYAARDYFRTAEGYSNSKNYLSVIDEYEKLYLRGVDFLEAKDYSMARKTFEAVEAFGNSAEYIAYIDGLEAFYREGMQLYSDQDYVTARERFVQADGYGSSADYIASIDKMEAAYQIAMGYFNEHKFRSALAAFEAIGTNYRDTYDMISACYGELEHGGVTITAYLAAYKQSHKEQGTEIRYDLTDINETGFMVSDSLGILFIGNTDPYGTITSVSFWIEDALIEEMSRETVNGILAHCIRALGIDMMSYEDVLKNLDSYVGGRAIYANFTFELTGDDSGHTVLNARFADE